ncbi:hypothetical protein [Photorhabdus africana]|uniref:hypothetical protein n=1 Tax=Photorhabdus africana TaxID=3097554 RepID=UPI002B413196|nr:hypothetical protein [Photorhabdus sp. CRI-LC]
MAPDLISSYSKDLSEKPSCVSSNIIDEFYCLSPEDDLLKIIEYALAGSEYDYYSEIIYMGCSTPDFYSEHAECLRKYGYCTEKIIDELLSLDMHESSEDILVGRVLYNDFNFIDKGITQTGKQIKGVYTLWISRCIAAARERIPGSIDNYVTGVSECSQQRSNLKDDGYI